MQLSLRNSDPGAGLLTDPAFNSTGPVRRATYCTSSFLFGPFAAEGAQLVSKSHQNSSRGSNNSGLKSGAVLSVCDVCDVLGNWGHFVLTTLKARLRVTAWI